MDSKCKNYPLFSVTLGLAFVIGSFLTGSRYIGFCLLEDYSQTDTVRPLLYSSWQIKVDSKCEGTLCDTNPGMHIIYCIPGHIIFCSCFYLICKPTNALFSN